MKFRYLLITLFLTASVVFVSGCFNPAKTDVETEQEILNILQESDNSDDNLSEKLFLIFDNVNDETNQVSTDFQNENNNSEESMINVDENVDSDSTENTDTSSPSLQDENVHVKHTESTNKTDDVNMENVNNGVVVSSDSGNSNQIKYVLNTNTKKFHYMSCDSVSQIKAKNYSEGFDRESIIASGYKPCKRCNP